MRALLLLQLVFGHSRAQSGDGISGIKRVTTSFDIVTETKITYRPDLLDTSTPAYSAEKNRVVDETRPGFEAAAARTGATLISVDVLFSLSSSGFSARRRRQATQTVYTQITPTFSIVETDPDIPQFELSSVAEAEQEMRSVVQAADSGSVFVRDAAIETGTASSTSVDVPLDFPIVDGGTTTTRATTTTTVASGNGFPVVDGVTTTTRATTTTRSTTTTTRAGGATAPTDYPIYDGEQATQAPTNEPGNDFPIVDDVTTTTRTTTKTTTKTATTTTTRSDGDFPVVDGATTTARATTTTISGNNFPVVDDTEIIEDNTDNDTVTTTTVTTRSTTVPVNPGTIPTGFPIYDDQQPVTVDDNGLFPVIDDTTTTESDNNNNTTTITERSTTTDSVSSQTTPTDFPIYDPDQNITDVNTGFPVVPETNSTTTIATNTTTTANTTTTEEITNTTTEFSTESVSLGTTARPNTTTTEETTITSESWNSGSRIILSFSLILSSLLFL